MAEDKRYEKKECYGRYNSVELARCIACRGSNQCRIETGHKIKISSLSDINAESIELDEGKYTVILTNNGEYFRAKRYGEEWRVLVGDGLVLAMFYEIQRLQKLVDTK